MNENYIYPTLKILETFHINKGYIQLLHMKNLKNILEDICYKKKNETIYSQINFIFFVF